MSFLDNTGLAYFYDKLKEKFIRSVNSITPDASGNVAITNVATADNLTSPDAQVSYDSFIYRTSGGSASLSSGEAQLVYIDGNMSVSGRVTENFEITTTNGVAATYSASIWRQQISESGTYDFTYTKPTSSTAAVSWTDSGSWSYSGQTGINLSTYGLYASNVVDPSISVAVSGSGITGATVIPTTWEGQVSTSGTYVFTYSTSESSWTYGGGTVSLATYGLAITGTAVDEDTITVTYVAGTVNSLIRVVYTAPQQGTITIATPVTFSATGFNQFDKDTMYVADATISSGAITSSAGSYVAYCKAVGGVTNGYVAYSEGGYITNIGWCASVPVVGSTVVTTGASVTSTLASIPFDDDGYVVVVVSDMSDLAVHPKWSGSADEEYEAYVAPSVITLPTEDTEGNDIPLGLYGMPAVGAVADRLNLDTGTYVQRIGRLANTTSNMNYVTGLSVAYDYDASYIYYVLPTPVTYTVDVDPIYTVNDWGTEEFTGTTVAVGAQTLYGQNLRDKLRTDVLTISSQELSNTQKTQVYNNLGLAAIHFTISSFTVASGSDYTLSDSRITANHRVANAVFGTPANVTSDISWTTSNGSVVFSGTTSAATTLDFDLMPTVS